MKIEYLLCDLCGKKIDMEKEDRASGKFELARIRMTLGKGAGIVSPLSPFYTEKIGELATKEVVEKVYIDSCEKCATKIEEFCTSLKEKQMPKQKKNESTDSK